MKNIKIRPVYLVLLVCLFFSTRGAAQKPESWLIRLGTESGVGARWALTDSLRLEGVVGVRWQGLQAIVTVQRVHRHIGQTASLHAYWGGGAHLGVHGKANRYVRDTYTTQLSTYMSMGLDLVGGLEFAPVGKNWSISLDWRPAINFTGAAPLTLANAGLMFAWGRSN